MLLLAVSITSSAGITMVALMVPLLGMEFGLDPAGVGLMVSSAYLLPPLLAIVMGRLVDRRGGRAVLGWGLVAVVVGLLPMFAVANLTSLIFSNLLVTLGHLALIIGSQGLVAEVGSGRNRTAAYGWWSTAMSLGQLIGPALAGIALDTLERSLVFAPPLAFLLLAISLLRITPVQADRNAGSTLPAELASGGTPGSFLRPSLQILPVRIAILGSFVAVWAMATYTTYYPLRLSELGLSATAIGVLIGLRAFAAVAVRVVMVPVTLRLGGRSRTLVVSLFALGFGLLVMASAGSWLIFAAVSLVMGTAMGLSQPVSMSLVADHVATGIRGRVLGVRLGFNHLAQLLAPVALLIVLRFAGLPTLFAVQGALVLLGGGLLLRWVHLRERRPASNR